jgi:protein-disulfide isomerase
VGTRLTKAGVLVAVVAVLGTIGGTWWYLSALASGPAPTTNASRLATKDLLIYEDDRILGNRDAAVTIIEYASFTCPHCAAFHRETLPQLKSEWIDTGKANFVMRDFPLDAAALKAAIVARCAPPAKFYGFVGILFRSQEAWARSGDTTAALGQLAKIGGISEEQFRTCMTDEALQRQIVDSRLIGEQRLEIDSTPTIFVNGRRLVGAVSYDRLNEVLRSLVTE